jgi:hypothetical protein
MTPDIDTNVVLTLTPDFGNPDLYLKKCPSNTKKCVFTKKDIEYVKK